jgi:hypothetical protein
MAAPVVVGRDGSIVQATDAAVPGAKVNPSPAVMPPGCSFGGRVTFGPAVQAAHVA